MQCSIVVHSQVSVQPANKPASGSLSPGQLRSAYGLSKAAQASNKGTIAIVDAYNDWHAAADLAKYRSYYGLGSCTTSSRCLRVVNQKGTTAWYPKGNSDWAEEESLDLDMVSAICPKCKIILVEANSNSTSPLSKAEDTAVHLGAKFVSNSWGSPEFSTETSYDSAFEHPGVAVTVAAGDFGYADGSQWPAVNPDVTAVGGTTLWMKGKTRTEEKVWNLGTFDGTGSGCSARLETQQAWQAADNSGCPRQPDRQRRGGGRRPADRAGRLRLLRAVRLGAAERLAAAGRDQRGHPDHRGRVRAGQPGRPSRVRLPADRVPLPGQLGPAGHHDRLERQLRRELPVHRRDRL